MLVNQLLFAFAGAVMVALAFPLMLRRVPPNGVYGLRVPATFQDEQVWYDANASSGRDLAVLGFVLFVLAFALPAFGVGSPALEITWATAVLVGALAMAVLGWRRANRMLRDRRAGRQS